MERRVGVIGAGYAGLAAVARLRPQSLEGGVSVELVSATPWHVFTTELHTVAAGVVDPERVCIPLRRFDRPGTRVLVEPAEALSADGPGVRLASGERRYEALILTLGWEPDFFGIPGLAERACGIGSLPGALALRERLRVVLAAGPPRRVVIAGGGLTGVELAAELAEAGRGRLQLTLVEAAPRILPGLDARVAEAADAILREELGVRVAAAAPVAAATDGVLGLRGGGELPFDVLVWCGGVRGHHLLTDWGLPCNRRGQVETDPALGVPGRPGLLVAGDAAAVPDPVTGRPLPPSAQLAGQQGAAAAVNALRLLDGRAGIPFVPHLQGTFISLGRRRAVGLLGETFVSGAAALGLKHAMESAHAAATGGVGAFLGRALGIAWGGRP